MFRSRRLIEEGFTPEEAKTVKIQKGKGCGVCNNTGYKGRCGLYEVMEVDDEIRELVLVGASAVELKKKAIERGMITLRRSGLIKVAAGMTTLGGSCPRNDSLMRVAPKVKESEGGLWVCLKRFAQKNAGDEWQRSSHHHQFAAANPRARTPGAARSCRR